MKFEKGIPLIYDDHPYRVHDVLPDGMVVLKHEYLRGESSHFYEADAWMLWHSKRLSFASTGADAIQVHPGRRAWEAYPRPVQDKAIALCDYITSLREFALSKGDDHPKNLARFNELIRKLQPEEFPAHIRELAEVIRKVAERNPNVDPPDGRTLAKYYRKTRHIEHLMPTEFIDKRAIAERPRRIPEFAFDLMRRFYQRHVIDLRQPLTAADLHGLVGGAITSRNNTLPPESRIEPPCYGTVLHFWNSVDGWDYEERIYGYQAAWQRYAAVGKLPPKSRPLQEVECDDLELDLKLIAPNDQTLVGKLAGLKLGTITVSVMLDVFTLVPLICYGSFEPSGASRSLRMFRLGVLPKDWVNERFPNVPGSLVGCGFPSLMIFDRGSGFAALDFENGILSKWVQKKELPARTPQAKPHVERFHRTLQESFVKFFAGYTGSARKNPERNPAAEAQFDIEEFNAILHEWLVRYLDTPDNDWGFTPREKWEGWFKRHNATPRLPGAFEDMDYALRKTVTRDLTREGLLLKGNWYNSDDVASIRSALHAKPNDNPKVIVAINPTDLGSVGIVDPRTKRWIDIPALDQEYAAGRDEFQNRLVQRERARMRLENKRKKRPSNLVAFKTIVDKQIKIAGKAHPTKSVPRSIPRFFGFGGHGPHEPAYERTQQLLAGLPLASGTPDTPWIRDQPEPPQHSYSSLEPTTLEAPTPELSPEVDRQALEEARRKLRGEMEEAVMPPPEVVADAMSEREAMRRRLRGE